MNAVFGVGMLATGEEQLATALESLGYKVRVGAAWDWHRANLWLERATPDILTRCLREGHDAWVGWPVACWRRLAAMYPRASFVLTTSDAWVDGWKAWRKAREEDPDWLRTRKGRLEAATVRHLFGRCWPTYGAAETCYQKHNEEVAAEAEARGFRLLEVDMRLPNVADALRVWLKGAD